MKLFIQQTNRLPEDNDPETANISEMIYSGDGDDDAFSQDIGELNVTENEEDYRVEIFLPGFRKSDIWIEAGKGGVIFISAESDEEDDDTVSGDPGEESGLNAFSCSFRLPDDCDTMDLEAYYENGVLTLLAPKLAKEDFDE